MYASVFKFYNIERNINVYVQLIKSHINTDTFYCLLHMIQCIFKFNSKEIRIYVGKSPVSFITICLLEKLVGVIDVLGLSLWLVSQLSFFLSVLILSNLDL